MRILRNILQFTWWKELVINLCHAWGPKQAATQLKINKLNHIQKQWIKRLCSSCVELLTHWQEMSTSWRPTFLSGPHHAPKRGSQHIWFMCYLSAKNLDKKSSVARAGKIMIRTCKLHLCHRPSTRPKTNSNINLLISLTDRLWWIDEISKPVKVGWAVSVPEKIWPNMIPT